MYVPGIILIVFFWFQIRSVRPFWSNLQRAAERSAFHFISFHTYWAGKRGISTDRDEKKDVLPGMKKKRYTLTQLHGWYKQKYHTVVIAFVIQYDTVYLNTIHDGIVCSLLLLIR